MPVSIRAGGAKVLSDAGGKDEEIRIGAGRR